MLNHPVIAVVLIQLLSLSVLAAPADQGHGIVRLNGEIMASACGIHTDDLWQEVNFPPVSVDQVSSFSGQTTRDFSLRLINCRLEKEDGSLWQSAQVYFDGEPDYLTRSLFALHGEAKGLALQLTDERGEIALPGQAFSAVTLNEGDQKLNYHLRVMRNGEALQEGSWSASLRFMVVYQ